MRLPSKRLPICEFRFAEAVGRGRPCGNRIKALLRRAFCGFPSLRSPVIHRCRDVAGELRSSSCPFPPALLLRKSGRGDRIRTCGLVVPNDAIFTKYRDFGVIAAKYHINSGTLVKNRGTHSGNLRAPDCSSYRYYWATGCRKRQGSIHSFYPSRTFAVS